MEYGLSYIISAKKLLKPQKKEANNGAEYNLVYLPLFGFTETTCVLNPFRFLRSLPPFTRASFFFTTFLYTITENYHATTCQK